jgi:protein required for attachment to host cells
MRIRIVVADENEARFYDSDSRTRALRLCGHVVNPAARLHDRDLKSDRPGRVFDRAPPASGRRGAVGHHGTGGERSPRRHEAQRFARRIVADLADALRKDHYDRLVLMAGLPFFGTLRAAVRRSLGATLAAEVRRDLVHQGAEAIREHLPDEVFRPVSATDQRP